VLSAPAPRPRPLARLSAALVTVALSLALGAGCSGAARQDVEQAPPSASAPAQDAGSAVIEAGVAVAAPSMPTGGGASDGSSGGAVVDVAPAPDHCPSGGARQSSGAGDTEASAKTFHEAACGTLGAGESYWWTFTLPAATTGFGLASSGQVSVTVTVLGTTIALDPSVPIPLHTGTPYDVQVTSSGLGAEDYVLLVTTTP